jgi:hypothetical protein
LRDFFESGRFILRLFIRGDGLAGLRFDFISRRRGRQKLDLRGENTRLGRDWFFNDILFFRDLIFR